MEYIVKQNKEVLTQKKLEGLLKLAEIIQWGRRNPIRFANVFLG